MERSKILDRLPGIISSAGFIFFAALAVASSVGYDKSIIILAAVAVLLLFTIFMPELRKTAAVPAALLLSAAALISFCAVYYFDVVPASALNGRSADVTATLIELPEEKDGKFYYTVKTDAIDAEGVPQHVRLRFSSRQQLDVQPYDSITANINFYLSGDDVSSPYAKYYASRGVYISGYTYSHDEITVEAGRSRPVNYYLLKLRSRLLDNIGETYGGEPAEVLKGMLLGDRSGVSDITLNSFRRAGIIHLLVVSGVHMTVVSGAVYALLRKLGLKTRGSSLVTCVFILLFMGVTAFSPSVTRAGIMCLIFFCGRATLKQTEPVVSLGIAAFVILIVRPMEIQNVGFLLSFASTLGIITVGRRLMDRTAEKTEKIKSIRARRFVRRILNSLIITFTATLFTIPILTYFFQEIYIWGLLTNILVIWAAQFVLVVGGLTAILGGVAFLGMIIRPLCFVTELFIRYIMVAARVVADLPYAAIHINITEILLIAGATAAGVAIVLLFTGIRVGAREVMIVFLTVVVLFLSVNVAFYRDSVKVRALDAGNNTCVLVSSGGSAFLVGCGFEYNTCDRLKTLMEQEHIDRLDAVILPTEYDSETSGLAELTDSVPVDMIATNERTELPVGVEAEIHACEQLELSALGGLPVFCDFTGDNGAVFIDCHGTGVLICSKPFSDLSYYSYDVLICRSAAPWTDSASEYVLIMDSRPHSDGYCTYDRGELLVRVDQTGLSVYDGAQ